MPNWCMTDITFKGANEEIKKLHEYIEKAREAKTSTDFNESWLGNLLIDENINQEAVCNGDVSCRGSVLYYGDVEEKNDEEASFYVCTDTAWRPMVQIWDEIITRLKLKTVQFGFYAEEPGSELYVKYDPHDILPDKRGIVVDLFLDGSDTVKYDQIEVAETKAEAIELLQKETNLFDCFDLDFLVETVNRNFKNEFSYLSIHKIEIDNELANFE